MCGTWSILGMQVDWCAPWSLERSGCSAVLESLARGHPVPFVLPVSVPAPRCLVGGRPQEESERVQ